jgi:uncharacterized SAM-binding protein YcdF (DUF218 family)
MKLTKRCISEINSIVDFLAVKDIKELNKKSLYDDKQKIDLVILLGSGLTYTIDLIGELLKENLLKEVMIVGGMGHSTKYLIENVKKRDGYIPEAIEKLSEAEIYYQIISKEYQIPSERFILEKTSKNCGQNAFESYVVWKMLNREDKNILLIQDPTMEKRTIASFGKEWQDEDINFFGFAPFIPKLRKAKESIVLDNVIGEAWNVERFVNLVLGEIPRLRDDPNGYGPKGKDFIGHIDIPVEIEEAYEYLKNEIDSRLFLR